MGEARERALLALCHTGGGSAWEEVLALVPKIVRARPPTSPSTVCTAFAYLVVHRGDDPDRAERLSASVARHRAKLDDEDGPWLDRIWPVDDVAAAQEWIDHAVPYAVGEAYRAP